MRRKVRKSRKLTQPRRLSNSCIGMAGVFYVCHELSLRGLIALPTARNSRGVDVLVYDPETHKTAALQVKASQDCVNFWLTPRPENCLTGSNTAWVFLRKRKCEIGQNRNENKFDFEVFLEESEKVIEYIHDSMSDERFPFFGVSHEEEDRQIRIKRLAANWQKWKP